MADRIADDLLIKILARLPVETLIRWTTVCKSWYSLITNPSFIKAHLDHSITTNTSPNLLLIHYCSNADEDIHSVVRYENNVSTKYAEFFLPMQFLINDHLRIIDSCNGLICLYDDIDFADDDSVLIYLWNPTIQQIYQLPQLEFDAPNMHIDGSGYPEPYRHIVGFGYDSRADDYKVVKIRYPAETPGEVDVFSLRSGTWRDISTDSGFPYDIEEKAPQAYLRGAAHWVARDSRGGEAVPLVVSFDMGTEVFAELRFPESITRQYGNEIVRVAKYSESLSLITGVRGRDYCVWVMKEYGVPESWTKQIMINMNGGSFHSIAGFTREGHVLVGTHRGYLVAVDPEAKPTTIQRINCGPPARSSHRDAFYADAYIESLVLLTLDFRDRITRAEQRAAIKVEIGKPKKRGCDQS